MRRQTDSQEIEAADTAMEREDAVPVSTWEVDAVEAIAEPGRAEETPDEPDAPPPVARIIEALLFVGGPPLTEQRACQVIRGLTSAQLFAALDQLNRDYRVQGRSYLIRTQDQGYVLVLRPAYRQVLEKLYGTNREARLSPQAIDVLALVAYRQPVTKQEVESLRGADSGNLLRQLVRRGLVAVVQRAQADRREVAYGTTRRFLDLFGLTSLEDLPQTQDLQKL